MRIAALWQCGTLSTTIIGSSLATAGFVDSLPTAEDDGSHGVAGGDPWARLIGDLEAGAGWTPETRSGGLPHRQGFELSKAGGERPHSFRDSNPPRVREQCVPQVMGLNLSVHETQGLTGQGTFSLLLRLMTASQLWWESAELAEQGTYSLVLV